MTSKEKVLRLRPTAIAYKTHVNGQFAQWNISIDGVVYAFQNRQSWAWAEALRILTLNSKAK